MNSRERTKVVERKSKGRSCVVFLAICCRSVPPLAVPIECSGTICALAVVLALISLLTIYSLMVYCKTIARDVLRPQTAINVPKEVL